MPDSFIGESSYLGSLWTVSRSQPVAGPGKPGEFYGKPKPRTKSERAARAMKQRFRKAVANGYLGSYRAFVEAVGNG